MKRMLGLGVVILLAACGQAPQEEVRDEAPSSDMSVSVPERTLGRAAPSRRLPPGVNPTAAPGVAWEYESTFCLADERISAVQEQHAAACEALGVTRCRIVGLDYTVDENDVVQGQLDVKLEPTIARRFGKEAFAVVDRAQGRLISTEFTGEDVGSRIATNAQQLQLAEEELNSVVKEQEVGRSANPDAFSNPVLYELPQREDELRSTIAALKADTARADEQLANTPMTLRYYGEGSVPGFDENPFKAAWVLFMSSTVLLVSFVLKALAIIIPWGALLALLTVIWRLPAVRRLRDWWIGHTRLARPTPEPE